MTRKLIIKSSPISDDTDCYIIAEIGHNHQGEVEKAKELFRVAKECGADAVKLQKRENRTLFTRDLYDKPYEHRNSFGRTYGEHREFLEFGWDEYIELKQYANELGIAFFATAFDIPSSDFLAELDVPAFKIASGDLRNIPLLRHVAQFQKPIILSSGAGTLEDIRRAYETIIAINPQLALLQCTANYPTPPEEMNLKVIQALRQEFPDVVVGLSDHYNGIAMAVAAYVLGARIIEKHFTLDHTWRGSDHAMSLEPLGMRKMVRDLRRARVALGDGVKCIYPSEESALQKMGKGLVAARELPAGHVLTVADVAIKSPNLGVPPYELENIIGHKLKRPLVPDEGLLWQDLLNGTDNE